MTMKPYLVIGGGRGLGLAVVRELLREGWSVVVADLCMGPVADEEAGRIRFVRVDLSGGDLSPIVGLDVAGVVVTAGIGRLAWFETFSDVEIKNTLAVNAASVLRLVRSYYGRLTGKEPFPFAIVSSIAGQLASPLYAVYSASKAALARFMEAVNAELAFKGSPNRLLDVAPGRIEGTGFHGGRGMKPDPAAETRLAGLAREILRRARAHETRYIPDYEEVYARVLTAYHADPGVFAQESLRYKLGRGALELTSRVRVGYLTGSFDLFHIGHLNLLRNARKHCDCLIVGVHRDGSHKGKTLFVPLEERMEIVRSVRYVDEVIVCSSEDVEDWPRVRFNKLFVGSDYKGTERFARYETYCAKVGAEVVYLPYTQTTSSTQLRAAITEHI